MRLLVCGATGGVGEHVVRQALAAGHQVTAVVRDPARLTVQGAALEVVTAQMTDPEPLVPAFKEHDAVISGIGPRNRKAGPVTTMATRTILAAMEHAGLGRLVVVSAMPVGPIPEGEPAMNRYVTIPLLRRVLRDVYADLAETEEELRRSTVDWTVVRPPRLTTGPLTGDYRRVIGGNVRGGRSISRADVAHAMLATLDDPATVRQAVGVAR